MPAARHRAAARAHSALKYPLRRWAGWVKATTSACSRVGRNNVKNAAGASSGPGASCGHAR
ncbi:MAG: hypothetical protein V8T36_03055 [Ruthenibacterium lactatiformans]